MSRFVQVKGYNRFINADKVRGVFQRGDHSIVVEYSDEETEVISFEECFSPEHTMKIFVNDLRGSTYIKQVIPVNQAIYAVYENDDGKNHWAEPIHYMVLTADGELKGVVSFDGYFEVVDAGISNCIGLYYQHELEQFNIVGGSVEAADQ